MAEAPRTSTIDVESQVVEKPVALSPPQPAAAAKRQANPGPLGLFCFGMTTLMLMYVEAEWVAPGFVEVVCCTAIFYGGAAQVLAGMWEMYRGSTFGALAFTSYGAFWLGWAILKVLKLQGFVWGPDSAEYETGQALYLGQWGVFTFLMCLLIFKKPIALQFTFWVLTLAFFLLAAGEFHTDAKIAGGYMGLLCACGAIYTAMGELVEEIYQIKIPFM